MMSDFNAKMQQIVCRLGLQFRPRITGELTVLPDLLAGSDMAVGPIFKTQPNPTHDFTDPTQPNPPLN